MKERMVIYFDASDRNSFRGCLARRILSEIGKAGFYPQPKSATIIAAKTDKWARRWAENKRSRGFRDCFLRIFLRLRKNHIAADNALLLFSLQVCSHTAERTFAGMVLWALGRSSRQHQFHPKISFPADCSPQSTFVLDCVFKWGREWIPLLSCPFHDIFWLIIVVC